MVRLPISPLPRENGNAQQEQYPACSLKYEPYYLKRAPSFAPLNPEDGCLLSIIVSYNMNRRQFLGLKKDHTNIEATSKLAQWYPLPQEWTIEAVNHLYNRLGFSATTEEINQALKKSPGEVIDELMDDALVTTGMPEPPEFYERWMTVPAYRGDDYATAHAEDVLEHDSKTDIRNWWTVLMTKPEIQLRERLVYFWHNHFVIEEVKIYYAVHYWRYFEYLRKNAWGNLKQMVKDITIMPAMLKYLDGQWSQKSMINENYAREVMELFTMGITDRSGKNNYTQEDVHNLAFALTGWRYWFEAPPPDVISPYFADYYFDFETKRSIWGSEAKVYGLAAAKDSRIEADVIDLLFEQRGQAIAWHIAKKVYVNFIYRGDLPDSSNDIIQELADTLIAYDWELKPMLSKLFKSQHFFSYLIRGGAIKSPYEFMVGICRKLNIPLSPYQAGSIWWYGMDTGQYLGNPTNVKGWEGYRTWLNTATLPKRLNDIVRDLTLTGMIAPRIVNPHNGFLFDSIPFSDEQVTAWATQFESYAGELIDFLQEINHFLLGIPISIGRLNEMINRAGITQTYEWPSLSDESKVLPIRRLLFELLSAPEYQLA